MSRSMRFSLIAILAAAAMACGGAPSQARPATSPAPPGPVVQFQSKLEGVRIDAQFDVLTQVIEFAPGAATAWHSHPAPTLVTVLEGAVVLHGQGPDRVYTPNETWIDPPGIVHQAANAAQSTSRMLVALVVPKGNQPSTVKAGMPVPTVRNVTVFAITIEAQQMAGAFNVVQLELDFAPGAQTPRHFHGGVGAMTVLDGEITIRNATGDHVYKAGNSFLEPAGDTHQALNLGSTPARMLASFVLSESAALTTPAKG